MVEPRVKLDGGAEGEARWRSRSQEARVRSPALAEPPHGGVLVRDDMVASVGRCPRDTTVVRRPAGQDSLPPSRSRDESRSPGPGAARPRQPLTQAVPVLAARALARDKDTEATDRRLHVAASV